MQPSGFELAIPAIQLSQTHALDSAATGIGYCHITRRKMFQRFEGNLPPSSGKRRWWLNFMFLWPRIVVNLFLIKPTDALIFSNLFLSRNSICFRQSLCPSSGVLNCTFGTGICHASLMTAFKHIPERAWKLSSNLHDMYQCRMCSGELLMMGRGTARNM